MNRKYMALLATGAIFATSFAAAGCAAQQRAKTQSPVHAVIESSAAATTTRSSAVETKIVTVFVEKPIQATTSETTEETEEAKPTAKPTKKPTAKPTKKPTAKPTKKPTAKPTAKPTNKPTNKPAVKTVVKIGPEPASKSSLTGVNNTDTSSKQISGIYRSAWSEMTVDATNAKNVKLTVTIHDQDDTNKSSVWKMNGAYNPDTGALVYTNCTKTNFTYDENNNVVSKATAYEKGQGKIVIRDGMVTWTDYQEHVADDMTFMASKNRDHGAA